MIKHLLCAITTGDPKGDEPYSSSARKQSDRGGDATSTGFDREPGSETKVRTLTYGPRGWEQRAWEGFLGDVKPEMDIKGL